MWGEVRRNIISQVGFSWLVVQILGFHREKKIITVIKIKKGTVIKMKRIVQRIPTFSFLFFIFFSVEIMLLCYVTWTKIRNSHINQAYLYSMEFWKQAENTQDFTEVKVLAYLFLRLLEPLLWYCTESVIQKWAVSHQQLYDISKDIYEKTLKTELAWKQTLGP